MKLTPNILLLGSLAILATSPAASARGKGHTPKAKQKLAAACFAVVPTEGDDPVVPGGPKTDGGSDGVVVVVDGPDTGTTGNTTDGEVTTDGSGGTTDDGVVVVTEPGTEGGAGEPILDKDPDGSGAVPIDWIKRGDGTSGNPDEIFYNMAGGPVTMGPSGAGAGVSKGKVGLGQADRGAAIEAKGGVTSPQINREKKGPVALVKQGHVFLR